MTELAGLSAGRLGRMLRSREVSAVELTRASLDRIALVNPRINAFVRIDPTALQQAAAADRRLAREAGGPLTGIPVAVKDNLTTEGLETSCASRILEGFVPTTDATAVARLRRAGAVVIGKTNLDEFGMGSSTESSCHGPTHNPWDTDRVAGGSSGGSAAAVAARCLPLALGSDTGGSVRQPAALCGVVGIKPSYGRISRFGLVAFGSSLDQVGVLARDVADAGELLKAIAGVDPQDATSAAQPVEDYGASTGEGVEGMRIGVPKEYFGEGLDPEIGSALESAGDVLGDAGATLRSVSLPHTRFSIPAYYLLATAEASSNLARFDGVRYGRHRPGSSELQEMYGVNRSDGFGAEVVRRIILGTYALSAGYHDEFYGRAQRVRTLLRGDFLRVFAEGIDMLLTPTTPTAAFRLGEKQDDPLAMYLSDVYTVTANLAGVPAASVPVGRTGSGLPIGAQLIGPDFGEATLLRAAAVLERHFTMGPPPLPEGHV
jgi:aspartyl-tRNA(Asn)/glutamyl-tRNA(Gln) amidotransferase subunit A